MPICFISRRLLSESLSINRGLTGNQITSLPAQIFSAISQIQYLSVCIGLILLYCILSKMALVSPLSSIRNKMSHPHRLFSFLCLVD